MHSLLTATRTLWQFVTTIVGFAVVSQVRHGTLNLRQHPGSIAGITWVVAAVIGLLVACIAAANPLRESTALIAVVDETGNSIVPAFLVPAILFLLALAIALVLAGSQRIRGWLRPILLIAGLAILASLITTSATVTATMGASKPWTSWTLLVVIIFYSLLMWTGRTRASTDFFALLGLCLAIAVLSYRGFVAGMSVVDTRFDLLAAKTLMITLNTLAMPLAIVSGLNATKLGASILEQAGDFVARRTPVAIASLILSAVIVWQIVTAAPRLVQRWSALGLAGTAGAVAGGIVLLGMCLLVWRFAHRCSDSRGAAEGDASNIASAVAKPIAYGLMAPLLISNVLGLVGVVLTGSAGAQSVALGLVRAFGSEAAVTVARAAVIIGLAAAGLRMVMQGRSRTAALVLIDALLLAVVLFAVPLMQAARLSWSVAGLGDIGLVVGTVLFCWWTVRRTVTAQRLVLLYTLILLSALIRRADYFNVPFGFLIGSSAIAVLIVGLVWGFLTDGGDAHESGPNSPRDGKLLLFLGSFLFSLAVAGWAVIGRQVDLAEELTKSSELGVLTLGTSYLIVRILDSTRPTLLLHTDVEIGPGDRAGEIGDIAVDHQHVAGIDETGSREG